MNKWREGSLKMRLLRAGDRLTCVLLGLEALALWLFLHPNA